MPNQPPTYTASANIIKVKLWILRSERLCEERSNLLAAWGPNSRKEIASGNEKSTLAMT